MKRTITSSLIHRLIVLALGSAMLSIPLASAWAQKGNEAINPEDFTTRIDNRFFPLHPGTTFVYEGIKAGSPLRDLFRVTHDTKLLMGVTCRVVLDRAYVDGVLEEETLDFFAQDEDGNVWYFGEDAKQLDPDGTVVSTAGSWEAGVNGALPGIVMEAHPRVGDTYRQEFAQGIAEDMGTVVALHQRVKLAHHTFKNCLETKDFTPLDSGVENKWYAPGVGFILSIDVGGTDHLALVDIVKD